jgi:archaellum biogenesis protein FlaJ (TadC family)
VKSLLAFALFAVLVVLVVIVAPEDRHYDAERTAQVQAQEAARTERAATLQYTMLLLVVVVVVVAGAIIIVAWLRRPVVMAAPPAPLRLVAPPPDVLRLAAELHAEIEHDPEYGWIVVEPDGQFLTVADARRLLA